MGAYNSQNYLYIARLSMWHLNIRLLQILILLFWQVHMCNFFHLPVRILVCYFDLIAESAIWFLPFPQADGNAWLPCLIVIGRNVKNKDEYLFSITLWQKVIQDQWFQVPNPVLGKKR